MTESSPYNTPNNDSHHHDSHKKTSPNTLTDQELHSCFHRSCHISAASFLLYIHVLLASSLVLFATEGLSKPGKLDYFYFGIGGLLFETITILLISLRLKWGYYCGLILCASLAFHPINIVLVLPSVIFLCRGRKLFGKHSASHRELKTELDRRRPDRSSHLANI